MRRFVKVLVFLIALSPAARVVTLTVTDILGKTHALGANPIDTLTDTTGIWTLRFVLLSLAITPLRRLTGWNVLIRYRRMLGLFAFFYASLHFTTWIGLDQGALWPYILPEAGPDEAVTWELILRDIAKRPYITVGFTGFVLMIPLASPRRPAGSAGSEDAGGTASTASSTSPASAASSTSSGS